MLCPEKNIPQEDTMTIYLDNAATTRVCPEAADAAREAMINGYGNPSSSHRLGRVAAALGAQADELYFTSCGTESDNWAILSAAHLQRHRGRHIISSMAEHDAVLRPLARLEEEGWQVSYLPPAPDGSVCPEAVSAALREDTVLVSLMLVNNETGAVTDIAGVRRALDRAGSDALLHTDAVQGFLKLPFSARGLGADMISVSGHKVHAPKGIGALYVRKGLKLPPLILGGGQEAGLRSGTESMPLIAAFAAAVRAGRDGLDSAAEHMAALKSHIAGRLTAENPELLVLPGAAPHILAISLPGYRSEVVMNYLDGKGICVSKSSACKKGRRSHVLQAMDLRDDIIDGTIRISLSRYTTREEAAALCDALHAAARELFKALG